MSGSPGGAPPPTPRPPVPQGHRRRRAARRLAIDLLYEADVMERDPLEVVREWREAGRAVPPYTEELVEGVTRNLAAIDGELRLRAEGWPVHRMPVVDRTILRVACQELRDGLPAAVAINEAVEAAGELSGEDSGRFINGVLGEIARGGVARTEERGDGRGGSEAEPDRQQPV